MSGELLLEIGTEDVPAKFFPEALENFKSVARENFMRERLKYGKISTFGTLRRMVLLVREVEDKQEDLVEEVVGPRVASAFDEKGQPTKASIGFAKAQGVDVSSLFIKDTGKGQSICVRKKLSGKNTKEILPEVVSEIIREISFPKSMRWGNQDIRFARPVHWILALYEGEIIRFKFGDVESSNLSFGHRFLSPSSFEVTGFQDYHEKCEKGFVIIDPLKRKSILEKEIKERAASKNGQVLNYEGLLETVNFMVEYPTAFVGSFPKEYLKLPEEVLTNTMQKQQMYFPLFDFKRNLLNYFIGVSDTDSRDMDLIIKGNERVLRARLADAEFFFKEDQRVKLEARVEALKRVIFLEKLGTLYDKVMRLRELALFLGNKISETGEAKINVKSVERAALLCKADLVTEMVKEFPELQGVMGREYARLQAEGEEVAQAIFEHYMPRFAEDKIPPTDNGAVLSLADKLDTVSGCFSLSMVPTGSEDPLGLRRQAIGIINIIMGKGYRLSLKEAIVKSLELHGVRENKEEILSKISDFFSTRLENILVSQGFEIDIIDSVLAGNMDSILDSKKRVEAISRLKKEPGFSSLTTTFKRAIRILPDREKGDIDLSLLNENAEKELYKAFEEVERKSRLFLEKEDYYGALKEISEIKDKVDMFFEDVMVMIEDTRLKNNRLNLLKNVVRLFSTIADFSKIAEE